MSIALGSPRTAAQSESLTGRFVPTRAGIINLWDYRDEEFVFADGWLVLRGPNGSGKTKALEVLFPFVLDGRIEPRRLNPFASEERTMKSNLLYRGQESGFSYAWLELTDGVEYVTVGVGLRAQKHSDKVTRWYFVADGRVGVDLSLLDAEDRPVVRKQLAAQLPADAVRDSAEEHRAAVDARLFGLGSERYEQLLNLVLTLRRPQLAKNLDPVRLSDTLTDGLRPIDEDLLGEAARSFDDMEAVQRTLDGLVAADEATRAFLAIYTTYLRTHARSAADAVSRRRADVVGKRSALEEARSVHINTAAARDEASAALEHAEHEPNRLRARLERLKTSAAYQSAGQLADLERLVLQIQEAAAHARGELAARRVQTTRRAEELAAAQRGLLDLENEASRLARNLAEEAEAAGIAWLAEDAEPDGFAVRLAGRVTARQADVAAVRVAAERLARAERDRDKAADALARARTAAADAESAELAAAARVEEVRADARRGLAAWADRHAETVGALGTPELLDSLAGALATAGEKAADDPRLVFGRLTATAVQALHDERTTLRSQMSTVEIQRNAVAQERAAIMAERDDAPAPWWARPADRVDRPGAPLWQVVRFADGLSDMETAAIEAALEAANLLDAWVHPDDATTAAALAAGVADGFLVPALPEARPKGRSLAAVLVPEEQAHVDSARIRAILESVALETQSRETALVAATLGGPSVSTGGQFAQGIQVGGYAKPTPEFIGATARARRRAARIADCDRRLGEFAVTIADLGRRESTVTSLLDAVAAAERELPGVADILEALRHHDRAATILRTAREAEDTAAGAHDASMAEVGAADLALRRVCAERSLPAEQIDGTDAAVRRFERTGERLVGARREAATAALAATQAGDRVAEAETQQARAGDAARESDRRHEAESEQLRALHDTVGAEAAAVLADVARTDAELVAAEQVLRASRDVAVAAEKRLAASETSEAAARVALGTAVAEEQDQARSLAPFAHADLLELLRCPTHLRWPAQLSDWPEPTADASLPDAVVALHEAILVTTRDLTPTETSIKQSATRLTKAFDDLQAQLSAASQEHRPEWSADAGIILVKVADEQGYAPVKVFADRVARERRDTEVLLTESERRILEDTLLGSLAGQIHQRTIDARDLVDAMDREMRSRRMSSGVSVGVGWQLADDLDEEQRAVCKLLEKNPARLGPDDLARLRRHFAGRIKVARAVRGEQSYRDLLASVLDYRRWRAFAFRLHRPGGQTEPLTKARHSQLSGGEQAVSLHLPLFAAAHALFTSARPTCPRLLALDEAFAGIDDTGRAELMGLAVQFDLDLLMTGYDLWATNANVPACAHYDLSHAPMEHTVSALLLVWDGAESLADFDGSLAASLGSPGTRTRPGSQVAAEDLFAAEEDVGPAEGEE